jgi:hypothetical protein
MIPHFTVTIKTTPKKTEPAHMQLSEIALTETLRTAIINSQDTLNKTYHASVLMGKIDEIKAHIKSVSKIQSTAATISFTPDAQGLSTIEITTPARLTEQLVETIIKYDEQLIVECLASLNQMWGAK